MSFGTIYMYQPKILINTNRYKIGFTDDFKNDIRKRDYIFIIKLENGKDAYDEILEDFKNNFNYIEEIDYFEGELSKIICKFLEIIKKYISKNDINEENNIMDIDINQHHQA